MTNFYKKENIFTEAIQNVFICLLGILSLSNCGGDNSRSREAVPVDIRVDTYGEETLKLDSAFDLTLALSNVSLKVTGCSSGYSATIDVWNGSIELYKDDTNCVIKLVSFTLNSQTYEVLSGGTLDPTGNSFNTSVGQVTTFESTTNSGDLIYAQVVTQLSSPITNGTGVSIAISSIIDGGAFPEA